MHHDLVLDFLKELIGEARVEDLFDRDGGAVQFALVDDAEATLGDFLAEFDVGGGDLSYAWDWWKSA